MRRKEQRSMLMLAIIMAFVVGVFWAGPVGAGGGNPCAAIQAVADRLGCELGESDYTDAPVEKTWQTTSYATGDDGDLQKGVAWPDPRFTDNENGTVTDNLTGLMWAKDAKADGSKTWEDALTYCNELSLGEYDDWRFPNVKELQSLIDYGNSDPALPSGHPFSGVESYAYWSSTTVVFSTDDAWLVFLYFGYVIHVNKDSNDLYVWPVRGGE